MNRVYSYLRASTADQDVFRAKETIQSFADNNGLMISAWFFENESGSKLQRPELFRLLDVTEPGDILLVEQVDRISRLNAEDWEKLKGIISERRIRIVALDLPTSHQFISTNKDVFTDRMLSAINAMMLDMLAAVARKDYEDRRRRQAEGVQKAKLNGKYKGRVENKVLHQKIEGLLKEGKSYGAIQDLIGCSRHTISKVKKRLK